MAFETATFGAGCFWGVEWVFRQVPGVIDVVSGYSGGSVENPTYEQVCTDTTGHAEVVQVTFDPEQVSYEQLLEVFWLNHDPTVTDRQFCDSGTQYRSGIYYHTEEQKRLAEASKKALEDSGRFKQPIVTEIVAATPFYRAEEYHQDYYRKNPIRFKYYKYGCGRAKRLEELWGK